MLQSERLEKMRNKHITINKTYPPSITRNVLIDYEAINPIDFDTIKNDIVCLKIINVYKCLPPLIYKNINTNQYYIQYKHSNDKFSKCLFDITDDYDWDKVMQETPLKIDFMNKKDFRIKTTKHIIPIYENKLYYPGSSEYDRIYPPVNDNFIC